MRAALARLPLAAQLRQFAQVGLLVGLFATATAVTQAFALPIAPGVLGLFALLLALLGGMPLPWVKHGAAWMLGELALFFIPGVVAVVKYADLFRTEGAQLVLAIVAGTVLVMGATALAVHAGCRLERRLRRAALRVQRGRLARGAAHS